MKKFILLLVLLTVVVPMSVVPALADPSTSYTYILHPPAGSPAAGWNTVTTLLVHTGCQGCDCGSDWRPGTETGLFEKGADRTSAGHNEGNGTPPKVPFSVGNNARPQCASGDWAAGTWYHNGVWSINYTNPQCRWSDGGSVRICDYQGVWGNQTWNGWNFAANDNGCGGSGGSGGSGDSTPSPGVTATPTPCPVTDRGYINPAMTSFSYAPSWPMVVGQGGYGFFVTSSFREGKKWYKDCHGTHYQDDKIVYLALSTDLAESSRRWIATDLQAHYPGVHVKGHYPASAVLYNNKAGTIVLSARWPRTSYYQSQDPGYYVAHFTLRTAQGHSMDVYKDVPVYLLDSTLIH